MSENFRPLEKSRGNIFNSINRKKSSSCIVMGILNVTPDSFYNGSRRFNLDDAVKRGLEIWDSGALWLDIGGESTRPGAEPVDIEEELRRVIPVIEELKKIRPDGLISIDTRRPIVAKKAINSGADMLNDVSGLTNPDMVEVVVEAGCAVCIMHMQGLPENMQENPNYGDCIGEVSQFLFNQAEILLSKGHSKELIVLDPGIGFGKKLHHNIELLKEIEILTKSKYSIMLGISRKSMIGQITGKEDPEDRLAGTLASSAFAFYNEIDIIRVHDVEQNIDLMKVLNELEN
ncbi:MAG: dihydropteroate synthase [Euryarchaeota archaeon]|nr:dihydropteroate synthase [Euryarchaeota archaeon]